MDWFTSDWHLGHDKEFIYGDRGFDYMEAHDEAVFRNLQETVGPDDTLYMLGDVMFSNHWQNMAKIKGLMFRKVLIIGNHDSNNKLSRMRKSNVFDEVLYADGFVHNKKQFMLTHIPLMFNVENTQRIHKLVNIHGHTHSKEKTDGFGHINVCLDAWDMKPVSFNQIMEIVNGGEE